MVNIPEVQHISDSDITACGEKGRKVNCLLPEWLKTHRKHFAVCVYHNWTLPIWRLAKLALMHHTIAATNKYADQESAKSVACLWNTYIHTYIHTHQHYRQLRHSLSEWISPAQNKGILIWEPVLLYIMML